MSVQTGGGDWYISRNGEQIGPMSRSDLEGLHRSGKLQAEDYVWSATLDGWKTATEILGRAPVPPPPPPPPKRPAPQPPASTSPAKTTVKPNFVKPNYDYDLIEKDDTLSFTIRTRSGGRVAVALLLMIPLIIFAWFAIFMGLIFVASGGAVWVIFGLIAAGLTYAVYKWGYDKTPQTAVIFDRDGIRIGEKNFSFEHVSHIGFDGGTQMNFIGTGAAATGAMLGSAIAEAAGYYIYMVYGSERIVIVRGLDAQNVKVVYDTISNFLARFGHNFG